MNALTAVKQDISEAKANGQGFTVRPSAQSPRMLELNFDATTIQRF